MCHDIGAQLVTLETAEERKNLKRFFFRKSKKKKKKKRSSWYIRLRIERGTWRWTEAWQHCEASGRGPADDCQEINS